MRDTHYKFTLRTISLHWIIAVAMVAMLAFGLYLEGLPRSPDKGALMGLHKSVGVIILVFAAYRVYWRHVNKFPMPLTEAPTWQEKIGKLTHWVLLLGTILMPISGIMMSIGGGHSIAVFGLELYSGSGEKVATLSKAGHLVHGLGGKLLIAFVVLHVAAAIKHQVIDKDGTISRMLGANLNSKL